MQKRETIIQAFDELGCFLREELSADSEWLKTLCHQAYINNGWFEEREVKTALDYWSHVLNQNTIETWVTDYAYTKSSKKVGLILAGNIPMVGFHDILATILSGHHALIKLSSSDNVIIPTLIDKLKEYCPGISEHLTLADRLKGHEAAIATGSNNSTRYFKSYFEHLPNVIRGNKTGIAILTGEETGEDLNGLMRDYFTYFGLGCRNVTKLYLPVDFDLNKIFEASTAFPYLMDNKKYANNYTYHKALMMLERRDVLDNDLILLTPNPSLYSPVSVLNYEYYKSEDELNKSIEQNLNQIQCVVGLNHRKLGSAQSPKLDDYADGVNTLDFLSNLHG